MNIWTNGCYDILHIGHIKLLKYASSLGNLYVGIDSDQRIKTKKGINRPINNEQYRKEFLENIKGVQQVNIFHTDNELQDYIKQYDIDIIVIGEDYKNKNVIGSELVKQIIFYPKYINISSSKILCNLQKNNSDI